MHRERATLVDIVELGMDVDGRPLKSSREEMQRFVREGKRVDGAARGVEKSASAMGMGMKKAALGIAAAATAAVSFGAAMSTSIQSARNFGAAMGETSTLINGTASEMAHLESEARRLGVAYGTGAETQVRAFYQAISAGAGSIAEATELLDASNRLAIGGITDVTTATGALASAVNAYGKEALTYTEVSDALFVGMRGGVTTVGELAASLGKVTPLAASAGVSFDQVVASVSALTKGGISTTEAVTGLRAILAAVTKPSKEAADLAQSLGIEFNTAGIEALGLAGFMEEVAKKTGGSNEQLALLFGGVEAIIPAMALAGSSGEYLADIMEDMGNKAGSTTEAYEKMADVFDQRLKDAMSALSNIGLTLGNAMLTVLVPALESVATVATAVAQNSDALAISFGLLAASKVPALVTSLMTLTTWLATSEGLFIAGAIAAKGLSVAMSLIPGVAILSGLTVALTGIVRGFRESRNAAAEYEAALRDLTGEQDALNTATATFYNDMNKANLEAMKIAAQRARDQVKAAIDAAQAELEAASFTTNFFGVSLFETERMAEARAKMASLNGLLVEAEARLSAADHAASNLNDSLNDGKKEASDLSLSIQGISFATANSGAERLAELLGISVTQARLLKGLLPNEGEPEGLSFGLGSAGVGGVTYGSGLSFGDNPGEIPIPGVSDTSGGGASAAEKQAKATQKVIDNLRMELDLIGATETARRTKQALHRAGVDLYSEEGQAIADLVEQIDSLEGAQKRAEQMSQTFKDAIIDSAMGGADAFDQLKDAIKRAALEYLLFGEGMFAGGGSGGFGGLLGGIFDSFDGGGYTGSGSRTGGVDGKGGFRALLHPEETIIDHTRGQSAPQAAPRAEIIVRSEPGTVVEIARQEAVTVTREGLSGYDRQLPGRVKQINSDPRRK